MKTRLYHKWLVIVKSHIDKNHINWAWCNRILHNEKLDLKTNMLLSYAMGIWRDQDNWSSMSPCSKKETDKFKYDYRKYSRKYWTPEARMMRMLKGEDD